jgi:hypothetical protein
MWLFGTGHPPINADHLLALPALPALRVPFDDPKPGLTDQSVHQSTKDRHVTAIQR